MTRRTFAKLWTAAAGAAVAPVLLAGDTTASAVTPSDADVGARTRDAQSSAPAAEDDKLQSDFLFGLVLDRGPANNVGSLGVNRVVVPVTGGTFEGPKLKGTVVGPGGDWIVTRPDGSSILDIRILLQTDDAQKIYMTCRGIAYTQPGGTLYARILPVFETGAAKYVWLNNVVAVGVFRPMPGKVAYRIYRIL
ncbi:MAG: DUF3237 domain-containing protein [Terriglobia bacterium]